MKPKVKTLSVITVTVLLAIIVSVAVILSVSGKNDVTMPVFIFDYTDKMTPTPNDVANMTVTDVADGILFTATKSDPNCLLGSPNIPCKDMCYMVIGYKPDFNDDDRSGEVYYATSGGEDYAEATKMTWVWEESSCRSLCRQVIGLTQFAGKAAKLTKFRFDPIAAPYNVQLSAGESIEIAYVAFFANENDANAFDFDSYKAELKRIADEEEKNKNQPKVIEPGDWTVPEYKEMLASVDDNYAGTLTVTPSGDGKNVTVRYMLNGQEVSYTVPNSNNYLSGGFGGTDDLGRAVYNQYTVIDPDYTGLKSNGTVMTKDVESRTVGVIGDNGEHYVGLFYFLWLGEHGDTGIYNMQEIIDKYGDKAGDPKCGGWGGFNEIHFFAEPLYGYYYSNDIWVMRKHVEMLTNAGVDFLYFDCTNNSAYSANAIMLMSVLHEFNEAGYDAPKVVFYTNTDAKTRVKQIYNNIYSKNIYPDTWFCYDGKPLIIAPEEANINGFFTIREPQWPNETQKTNAWPWIDWNWPQKTYTGKLSDGTTVRNEAVNVSVAQHSGNGEFSTSALYGYTGNRGRSFNGTNDLLTKDSYKSGLNIQNEFNFAIAQNTKVVLITGWNEWIAFRQADFKKEYPVRFVDTCSYEYSRDIEMSKGGYFDNYYMQMLSNISAIKGSAPVLVRDSRKAINVTGEFSQWTDVTPAYTDPANDSDDRNGNGFGNTVYTDTTGRNDIISMKVTSDTTYLYLYAACSDTIKRQSEKSTWMQVYLSTGKSDGWYGYDYIINNTPKNDLTTTVAKYSGKDGEFAFTDCGEVSMRVLGNEIMIAVPLELIGIEEYDRINIQFKWLDSTTVMNGMEDFYTHGDVAPLGRLNYIYQNYIPGVTEGNGNRIVTLAEKASGIQSASSEEPETTVPDDIITTAAETDTDTAAETDTDTLDETETERKASKSTGCSSVAPFALITVAAAGAVMRKKKYGNAPKGAA